MSKENKHEHNHQAGCCSEHHHDGACGGGCSHEHSHNHTHTHVKEAECSCAGGCGHGHDQETATDQESSGDDDEESQSQVSTSCGCSGSHNQCTRDHGATDHHDHHHSQTGCGCGHDHDINRGNPTTFLYRLLASLVITAGVAVLDHTNLVELPQLVSVGIYLIAFFLAGYEVVAASVKNILKGKVFDENFLMSIAAVGAFFIGEMPEAIAVMIFYGIGEMLQEKAVNKSRKNIAELMDIRPDYANVKTATGVVTKDPKEVMIGDIIVVKPGEKIPLDGEILMGTTFLDTVALTGESVPRSATVGDEVLSGSLNKNGLIEIKVSKNFSDSTVSKILELVQNASSKKAESEKFITKFARVYTPIVVLGAVSIAVLPPLLGGGLWSVWIYKALSFLLISCPCALVVSIPVSFFGGIGGAAKQGILIKGGNYLESLTHLNTVVFDKTGTLTKGIFEVTEVIPANGVEEEDLLRLAAIAESQSNHPIAKSILKAYKGTLEAPMSVTEKAGYGMIAQIEAETTIYAGNKKLMEEIGIRQINESNKTIVHIALNKEYQGAIIIADEIKETTKQGIDDLKAAGVDSLIMLTGDANQIAEDVANELGLTEYHGELLPQHKVEEFERILERKAGNEIYAFVGDGINDSPVLTRADVGIAMGGVGSDAAIEAADVVIMNDDIGKIAVVKQIAKKTRRIVVQNIVFALGTKVLIMILAIVIDLPILVAILADVGVSLLAVLNATRAMNTTKNK